MDVRSKNFELVEHTADIGLKVYGKSEKELFINAARGMFFLITGSLISPVEHSAKKYFTVETKASNIEDLIIEWLNELLYIHATELVVFDNYNICHITGEIIKSEVSALYIKDSSYQVVKEIKAVTYHNIYVHQLKNGKWEANIVFDI